ncbi:MAG: ABC-2 family transporter protein [Treponema sp.]|jgi:ABC-2 type transport system permease protein|nr:ABC-2 family transporter protein [Treponema sp.]
MKRAVLKFSGRARAGIGLYLSFTKIAFRSIAIYRSAYWLGVVAQWLSYGISFAVLFIMVRNFRVLAGWNSEEILFLYAMNLLSYALGASFFFNPCMGLPGKIRTGEFDIALTKPVSAFGHEVLNGFNFGYLSHITLSTAVMIFSLKTLGIVFSPASAFVFLALLLGAALIQASLLIFGSAWSFFTVNENPAMRLIWTLKDFINYPLPIYPGAMQVFLTFIVPMGFLNYYPGAVVLGKSGGGLFPPGLGYLTPFVGIAVFILSIRFWNWALSKYQSTGT